MGRNLIRVPAEMLPMIRVAIVTSQSSPLSYPSSLTSLPDASHIAWAGRLGGGRELGRIDSNIFI